MLTQVRREYPVADDRGGIPEDFDNYVTFLKNLRNRLSATGRPYGVSITLASRMVTSEDLD